MSDEPQESVEALVLEAKKHAELEMLNWIMRVASGALNVAHVRKIAHNRFVEISGEGEKA